MEEKYKKLLKEFLEAVYVYSESGFDDILYELEDKVKEVIGDENNAL